MLDGKTIGVVIPAYNEELLIARVFETMPAFVDFMFPVNDGSKDRTRQVIEEHARRDPRIVLVNHETNKGLGQSLIDGYLKAREQGVDVVAVMAGDAQMSPNDLEAVVGPIVREEADYVKGNRLLREDVVKRMPKFRFFGNNFLTLLTKFATGYWHVIDPQCGYTAVSKEALAHIPIETMTQGYGYNAHILNMLNLSNYTVMDVEVEPVYGAEKSKIKIGKYTVKLSILLARLFWRRMTSKYFLREFHPLFLLYGFAFVNGVLFLLLSFRFVLFYAAMGVAPGTTLILLMFSFSFAVFSLIFAMWMDMEENRWLRPARVRPGRLASSTVQDRPAQRRVG